MANIIEMPKLGFDMAEGTLIRWVKDENEKVNKGDIIVEIETDKATVEVESSFSGIVVKHLAAEGQALPIGSPIAVVGDEGEEINLDALLADINTPEAAGAEEPEPQSVPLEPAQVEPQPLHDTQSTIIKASPIAKRIAVEKGIPLSSITGTGPSGRIVRRDVEKATAEGVASAPQPTSVVKGVDRTIQISKLRAAIGKRLTESRQTIPHFFITNVYNVSELLKTRKQFNKNLPEEGRVSVNDFIIRAVALALRDFPNLNASLSGNTLILHGDINIGVAVAVENGLLTVVVRNADQKPLSDISRETKTMIARVKEGKLRSEDIEGSTFTISNLGMYAVEDFVAIINPPEAAILAVASAKEVPIVVEGELDIGWRMKATISADHRITDGAEAAKFMRHLGLFLEQPWRLFV